jgi:polyhydroxybutyrate depolymerase
VRHFAAINDYFESCEANMTKLPRLLTVVGVAILLSIPACAGSGHWRDKLNERRAESTEQQAGVTRLSLRVQGDKREYLLYRPSGTGNRPIPLVIVLHGGGGNGQQAMKMSAWNEEAQRRGWMVAYPSGSGKLGNRLLTWNAGQCCGYAMEKGVDDVAFIDKMLSNIAASSPLDSSRVYVTGISNGAMLAYRLACEMSDRITAIAPVSGTLGLASCQPSRPVSIMHFHGTADNNVPFEGGFGKEAINRISKRSIPSTLDEWRRINQCPAPETARVISDTTFLSSRCRNDQEVTLVKIDGGGHAWPGSPVSYPPFDKTSPYIDATKEMAVFFSRHSR